MIPEKVWDEMFHDFSLRIDALGMLDVGLCVGCINQISKGVELQIWTRAGLEQRPCSIINRIPHDITTFMIL